MVCHNGGADRVNTRIVCGCVCHKRHCGVDRSVRSIMEAKVSSCGRTASCKWCHLHDTSADYLCDPLHETSANGYNAYRPFGSDPGGPILVVILGLGILRLALAKGIRRSRTAMAAAR